jgi:streptomycin 3"-adenylyltransferase
VIPVDIRAQVDDVVAELRAVLGEDMIGVYLHGSAVLDCFGPHSDIDLVAVLAGPTSDEKKRLLAARLLDVSAPYDPPDPPRPVELDVVTKEVLHPWRYPTPLDFHYSEEFREKVRSGDLEAWNGLESCDLAAHITVLRQAGVVLAGRPIESVFPDVPWCDYAHALSHDLSWFRERFGEIPRYAVLSGPRIWATLATGTPHSKLTGAEWALPRLPPHLRPVLEHGLAVYQGTAAEHWGGLALDDYIAVVAGEIERLTPPP